MEGEDALSSIIACAATLKALMFYTHQNFLTLIEIIITRLPPQSATNIWAHSLQAILLNKSTKKLLKTDTTANAAKLLQGNNEAIKGAIEKLIYKPV